jgi:hypothetical protein
LNALPSSARWGVLDESNTGRGQRKAHWQERKEAYLAHLRKADEDILRVSLADKVHYARAILRDLRKPDIGEEIWARLQSAQGADAKVDEEATHLLLFSIARAKPVVVARHGRWLVDRRSMSWLLARA